MKEASKDRAFLSPCPSLPALWARAALRNFPEMAEPTAFYQSKAGGNFSFIVNS